jgi:hypothetical protein
MAGHMENNHESMPSEPESNNLSNGPAKMSILDKAWFIVLMCIFVAPFGLVLLAWRKHPKNRSARIALIILMAFWSLCWIIAVVSPKSPQTATSTTQTSANSVVETKQAPTITGISATYNGSTKKGTVLNASNAGIKVVATYSDGTTGSISDYTIAAPATLAAGQTSEVTITSGDVSCQLSVTCTTLTEDQYKAQCVGMSYEDLARNPDSVEGSYVAVTGQVIQVQQGSNNGLTLRVSITKDSYDIWTDPVLVAYTLPAGADNILEKDIVTVYGVSAGDYTYTTVLGASMTVPSIEAAYIDIIG